MKNINYQQIYEDELSENLKDSLEWSSRFFELSNQHRMVIEELIDIGYRQALEEALDPEILEATRDLSVEMADQLYNFANMMSSHLTDQNKGDDD